MKPWGEGEDGLSAVAGRTASSSSRVFTVSRAREGRAGEKTVSCWSPFMARVHLGHLGSMVVR